MAALGEGKDEWSIAVNISTIQLAHAKLVDVVHNALQSGLPPFPDAQSYRIYAGDAGR
jgi:EAL domain-containing protein (putative c-di-GMP-specific phosphodiesterase class I)